MSAVAYAASAGMLTQNQKLICATSSSLWRRHIADLLVGLSTDIPLTLDGNVPSSVRSFSVDAKQLTVSVAHMVDLLDPEVSKLSNEFFENSVVVLFILGGRLDTAYGFMTKLAHVQRLRNQETPLLILTGLSADDHITSLSEHCKKLGLNCLMRPASVTNDAETLSALTDFLGGRLIPAVADITPLNAVNTPQENQTTTTDERNKEMASINESMTELLKIEGAMAAALVDSSSGMVMGKAGGGVNLDAAGAGNTEVVRAKMKTMKMLGLNDAIEDILITLGNQYHIIRPMADKPTVFIYLVLDKTKANLGMARYKTMEIEKALNF